MSCVVSFHAHPDDEVLLTGGSLARWHDEGHRVVLVIATDGAAGLTAPGIGPGQLAATRRAELRHAAAALGVDRIEFLDYPDSGWPRQPGPNFASIPVDGPRDRLAAILRAEDAAVLTVYDPAGGYGHPDHVRVREVGLAAAEQAGTPVVLEATVDRRWLVRALRLVAWWPRLPDGFSWRALERCYSAPDRLTHRIDVRGQLAAKRAAMQAHASQQLGGADRTLAWALRLPRPLFALVFGHEWFVQLGAAPGRPLRAQLPTGASG